MKILIIIILCLHSYVVVQASACEFNISIIDSNTNNEISGASYVIGQNSASYEISANADGYFTKKSTIASSLCDSVETIILTLSLDPISVQDSSFDNPIPIEYINTEFLSATQNHEFKDNSEVHWFKFYIWEAHFNNSPDGGEGLSIQINTTNGAVITTAIFDENFIPVGDAGQFSIAADGYYFLRLTTNTVNAYDLTVSAGVGTAWAKVEIQIVDEQNNIITTKTTITDSISGNVNRFPVKNGVFYYPVQEGRHTITVQAEGYDTKNNRSQCC